MFMYILCCDIENCLFSDYGNNLIGLRGLYPIGYSDPGMGRYPWNLASLSGNVRVDLRVHRSHRRSIFVMLCCLSGTYSIAHGRKYQHLFSFTGGRFYKRSLLRCMNKGVKIGSVSRIFFFFYSIFLW